MIALNWDRMRRQAGFTLIELLVTVAIIGILAAVAYPSYVNQVIQAKRNAGKSALVQVADRQEQFFLDNKRYTADLTQLGYMADPTMVDEEGAEVAAGDPDRVYQIDILAADQRTYSLRASPQLWQATKDTKCGNLTLTSDGDRGQSGAADNCW